MASHVTEVLSALIFRRQPMLVVINVDLVPPVILEMVHSAQVCITLATSKRYVIFPLKKLFS